MRWTKYHVELAMFYSADLSGADLRRAALSGTDLHGADLSGAALCWADLRWADLAGADLRWADLRWADLNGVTYDADTKWPDGFDPIAAGAILV